MAKAKRKSKSPSKADTVAACGPRSVFEGSPVYDLLRYFEKAQDQWAARYILVMSGIMLRTAVGLGSFLGFNNPPMHGDFEAQRHWMELTIHLPVGKWYFYDLQYWGLDYPPLTAYHLYILGKIGEFINPEWFALDVSRGEESDGLKFFMRLASMLSELIFYIPPILTLANMIGKRYNINRMDQIIISLLIINQAHLVLIDHGHFQFNSVMLGLFVYSVLHLIRENYVVASIWFVCCINFKQMGLFYSTFIFVFILSQLRSFRQLILVGFTVFLTTAVILAPFLKDPRNILQIVTRVFPFSRGLFEDKVANFWCTTNTFVKYRNIFSEGQLARLCLVVTVVSLLPVSIILFGVLRSRKHVFPALVLGFSASAFSFYLFSYQVHEKSILLPLLPSMFLILVDTELVDIVQWINNVGTFSLYPLLKRDDLILQYVVNNFTINWLIGRKLLLKHRSWEWDLVIKGSYMAIAGYHVLDYFVEPPARYPHLWVILNITISFTCFFCFWLWLNFRAYRLRVTTNWPMSSPKSTGKTPVSSRNIM